MSPELKKAIQHLRETSDMAIVDGAEGDLVADQLEYDRVVLERFKSGELDRDGLRKEYARHAAEISPKSPEFVHILVAEAFIRMIDEMGLDGLIATNQQTRELYDEMRRGSMN